MEDSNFLSVITGKRSAKIAITDIIYVEREGRRLHICTEDDEFVIYAKLLDLKDCLDARFYFGATGWVINFDEVKLMEKFTVTFFNGRKLMFARDTFVKARKAYNSYLMNETICLPRRNGTAFQEDRA